MSEELKKLIRLLEKHCHAIELISYGLAPNPNGFCYELFGEVDKSDLKEINSLLVSLNSQDENTLKELYLT